MFLPNQGYYQDFWLEMAVREIWEFYNVKADVHNKAKSLVKFGRTRGADANVRTTVALFQDTGVVNETFVNDNLISHISSEDTGDTEQTIRIEGHTIDTGSGDLTFNIQDVDLAGQTPVALTTPLARATRAYVKGGTFAVPAVDLSGNVNVYRGDTGVTAGKKTTASKTHLTIEGTRGKNQSDKAATSVSSSDWWILTGVTCSINRSGGATASAEFDIDVRQIGGVWRPLGLEVSLRTTSNATHSEVFQPYRIIPPNSDVRLVATSNVANLTCTGRISGILARV